MVGVSFVGTLPLPAFLAQPDGKIEVYNEIGFPIIYMRSNTDG